MHDRISCSEQVDKYQQSLQNLNRLLRGGFDVGRHLHATLVEEGRCSRRDPFRSLLPTSRKLPD